MKEYIPNTLGCGLALLIKIVVHGNANVLAVTCINSTPVIAIQINGPETPAGGLLQLGMILKNGVSAYVIGNSSIKLRKHFAVPILCDKVGYRKSCSVMPITPRMARARPMRGGGRAKPPVKWNGGLGW
jgi:hypothetical protein